MPLTAEVWLLVAVQSILAERLRGGYAIKRIAFGDGYQRVPADEHLRCQYHPLPESPHTLFTQCRSCQRLIRDGGSHCHHYRDDRGHPHQVWLEDAQIIFPPKCVARRDELTEWEHQ